MIGVRMCALSRHSVVGFRAVRHSMRLYCVRSGSVAPVVVYECGLVNALAVGSSKIVATSSSASTARSGRSVATSVGAVLSLATAAARSVAELLGKKGSWRSSSSCTFMAEMPCAPARSIAELLGKAGSSPSSVAFVVMAVAQCVHKSGKLGEPDNRQCRGICGASEWATAAPARWIKRPRGAKQGHL